MDADAYPRVPLDPAADSEETPLLLLTRGAGVDIKSLQAQEDCLQPILRHLTDPWNAWGLEGAAAHWICYSASSRNFVVHQRNPASVLVYLFVYHLRPLRPTEWV